MRLLWTLITWTICLIPFWVWLGFWNLLTPDTFWQKFFLVGVGLWILGGTQLMLLILAAVVTWSIWSD